MKRFIVPELTLILIGSGDVLTASAVETSQAGPASSTAILTTIAPTAAIPSSTSAPATEPTPSSSAAPETSAPATTKRDNDVSADHWQF